MSSSSLGRGIGAGTDGRDASEKHQRDFIPANVVTHEEVTEGHELLASEGLCEEIGGIVVGATHHCAISAEPQWGATYSKPTS